MLSLTNQLDVLPVYRTILVHDLGGMVLVLYHLSVVEVLVVGFHLLIPIQAVILLIHIDRFIEDLVERIQELVVLGL
jgi:hypothetical protein